MISKVVISYFCLLAIILICVNADDWNTVLDETAKRMDEDPYWDAEDEKPIVQKAHSWLMMDEFGKSWEGFGGKAEELKNKIKNLPEDLSGEDLEQKILNIYDEAFTFFKDAQVSM
ncbi:uncharacterized protein LOC141851463 [Brevipalpus obovatus]|uniref:uncharacterized protein LOC141851463 n=1 Tax=Brevipalpus obovatus TaxID=246614 RepID=UPI003D9F5AAB